MSSYNAVEVADYIIDLNSMWNEPTSNLRLQMLLYFAWVDYCKEVGKGLFYDYIHAWQIGPVVPEVYRKYCAYGGRPINLHTKNKNVKIKSEDADILREILEKYRLVHVSELVDQARKPGTAWYQVYDEGKGNRQVIPFKFMMI